MYEDTFAITYNGRVQLQKERFVEITHVFSHLKWSIDAYEAVIEEDVSDEMLERHRLRWVTEKEMKQLAFPVPYQKMFKEYIEQ